MLFGSVARILARSPGGCVGLRGTRLSGLPPQSDFLRHFLTRSRIARRYHGVIRLKVVALAIFFGRHAVGREVTAQCLVGLAVNHRDDVIRRCERLTRGGRWRIFGFCFRLRFTLGLTHGVNRLNHALQKSGHIVGGDARIGVRKPSDSQLCCEFDGADIVFQGKSFFIQSRLGSCERPDTFILKSIRRGRHR